MPKHHTREIEVHWQVLHWKSRCWAVRNWI